MVTSKERTGSKTGAIALLFSAAVMLFTLMFGGVAAADDQAATTANAGAAGANTGGNGAAGNGSANGAASGQAAVSATGGDDAVAPNSSNTGSSSNGSASITTGDANATGNDATNNTQQTVVEGHNGVVSITDQNATIFNGGLAVANTGGNVAVGNGSQNGAAAGQIAVALGANGDSVATNDAAVQNNSGGDARITTGDATATGSISNNTINQVNTVECSTCLGVVVLSDQNAGIVNVGVAVANTGGNAAVGNASQNGALALQGSLGLNAGAGDSVAANTATASNDSNGNAGIITGDATAVGNVATNNVTQVTNVNAPNAMGVIVLTDQNAGVANVGISFANTGLNLAVGNLSQSTSLAIEGAVSGAGPPADDSVASNDGIASNNSNGSASINTGAADATGNRSTTNLTQAINVNTTGNALVLSDQNAIVINAGLAIANTGGNAAVGNASQNAALVLGLALSFNLGVGAGDSVAANFGSADNTSNGSANITTGNASAAGNSSSTNVAQTVNANMTGGLVLPDQLAIVINAGAGIANSGLNVAVGNASQNLAVALQLALSLDVADDTVASNFGDASNSSNGSASITTGNADSIGNHSDATTNIAQVVDTNGANNVLSDQTAVTADLGLAVSNTGANLAVGNTSQNVAATVQIGVALPGFGDTVASNFGDSSTDSDGTASITTGNANAVGSASHTNIAQVVDANGANGFLLADQTAVSANIGVGIANTGLNLAVGNAAVSIAIVAQAAAVIFGGTGDNVAANFGSSKTKSNGSASVHTGNAAGIGSRSTTNVAQTASKNGTGFALVDQIAVVVNFGAGIANTGGNAAIGNASLNLSAVGQLALVLSDPIPPVGADLVASNDGIASTESNGNAEVWTGSAHAIGNDSGSTTNITQTSDVNGAGFALVDQIALVGNVGIAVANSGLNLAIGNASVNLGLTGQLALVIEDGGGDLNADDVVASNNTTSSNNSNGSAKIVTGPAHAVGNKATTNIAQTSDFTGTNFVLVDQTAGVLNAGLGVANSGGNLAIGNASQNVALALQLALVSEDDGGDLNADDVVAANTANNSNTSNGSATVITGSAAATGNDSTTNVAQVSDANLGSGFVLNDQVAGVINVGAGFANSGLNAAVGNASQNGALGLQIANVSEDNGGDFNAEDVVSANTSNNSNNSNGSASIATGWTDATGNKSTTTVNQVADTNIAGNGFVLNDQAALVVNAGLGIANSGLNVAAGNGSANGVAAISIANVSEDDGGDLNADDVVASNSSTTRNDSDGNASILTGAARAIGNESGATTTINQVSDTNIAGNGFVLSDQAVVVANVGVGVANSGLNAAFGNVSQNGALSLGIANVSEDNGGDFNAEDVVSVNTTTAANNSNGSANIATGNTEAIGNKSTTTVNQIADNNINGLGFEFSDQSLLVVNAGLGVANSGLNQAIGNASDNDVLDIQIANVSEDDGGDFNIAGDAVVANTQTLSNNSNGSANIATGDACGYGNISSTDALNGDGGQVFNLGIGVGNSGLNQAIGNASDNDILSLGFAVLAENDGGDLNAADDVVAANTVSSTNQSNGTANIKTGIATGIGNQSTTTVGGDSLVVNLGIGLANTGLNLAVANASDNDILSITFAGFIEAGAGDLNLGDDAVASNTVTEVNNSNGTAGIDTGDAYALGNRSATGIVDGDTAVVVNFGLAFANSGLNLGAGNTSNNQTLHLALAIAPGGVAVNVADLSNTSDGSATVKTGNANAYGNIASNAICQGVDFGPLCPQPTLPDLPIPCCLGKPKPEGPGSGGNPTVPVTPVTPGKPVTPVLARTGVSVEGLAMLGLLLLAIGVFLRRKARTA